MHDTLEYQVGYDIGRFDAETEAVNAYNMGEIDLWIDYSTPKTGEEWVAWIAHYGEDFASRWKTV